MLDTFGLSSDEKLSFESLYAEINRHFRNEIVNDIEIPLEKFEFFKYYSNFFPRQGIKINKVSENASIAIVQATYSEMGIRGGTQTSSKYQAWVCCRLPQDFGHLTIRRETLSDKLNELFQPLEMNFPDDKEFCRRFYVLSKDWQKGRRLLNQAFRDALRKIHVKDLQIEVSNNFLIAGNSTLNEEDVIPVTEFVLTVSDIRYEYYGG